jgi:hypothetical protein
MKTTLLIAFLVLFSACKKESPTEPAAPTLSGNWNSSITGSGYSSQPPIVITQQEQNIQFKLNFTDETWELYGTIDPATFKIKLTGNSTSRRFSFDGSTTFLYNRIDGTLISNPKDFISPVYYTVTASRN